MPEMHEGKFSIAGGDGPSRYREAGVIVRHTCLKLACSPSIDIMYNFFDMYNKIIKQDP